MASIAAGECERRPSTTRGADQRAAVSTSKMRSSQMKAVQVPKAGRKITPWVTISGGPRKAGEKKAAFSRVWRSWDSETMGGLLGVGAGSRRIIPREAPYPAGDHRGSPLRGAERPPGGRPQ